MVCKVTHARKQNPLSDLNRILQGGRFVSDIAVFVLKRDVKLQLTHAGW